MNTIDTKACEFGYEIIMSVPYANYLKSKNENLKVYSCKDTKCLYYFLNDDEHFEIYSHRQYSKPIGVYLTDIHINELDSRCFLFPDFKKHYKNHQFKFSINKPLVIISNKYNREWNNDPINFFSLDILDHLFKILKSKYTIIYNRPKPKNLVNDNSNILTFNDDELLNNHDYVIDINRLFEKYDMSFNLFQMLLYSRSEKFISVQGGNSILSSIFGGTNIIYAKKGCELTCGSFDNWYGKLTNCDVSHSNKYENIIELVHNKYL